jgi:hypothetical protein
MKTTLKYNNTQNMSSSKWVEFYHNNEVLLLILCSIGIASLLAFFQCANLDLKVALRGFSPIHYVHLKSIPENFIHNFPSGIEQYDKSLFMWIYPFIFKFLSIEPLLSMKIMIYLEYLGVFLGSLFFSKELFGRNSLKVGFICGLIYCSAMFTYMNISGYGIIFEGQFYNFVEILRILGIILFLREYYMLAGGVFSFSFTLHPVMTLISLFFCLGVFLSRPNIIKKKEFIFFLFIMTFVCGLWSYFIFSPQLGSQTVMSFKDWYQFSKLGNYHFYPFEMGLFNLRSGVVFAFLSFCLLCISCYPSKESLRDIDRKVAYGVIVLLGTGGLGLFFSKFATSVFLIKICLIRSFDLFFILMLPYLIKTLTDNLANGSLFSRSLSGATLMTNLLGAPIPIVSSFLLSFDAIKKILIDKNLTKKVFLFILSSCLIAYIIYLFSYSLFDKRITLYTGGVTHIGACIGLLLLGGMFNKYKNYIFSFFVVSSLILSVYHTAHHISYSSRVTPLARDYKDVQLWAKSNTPSDSLFFVDPTIHYGWRDFSERSSFGSLREWLHVSWLYNSDGTIFKEGMKRFELFAINIDDCFDILPSYEGWQKVMTRFSEKLYKLSAEWYLQHLKPYGVQYIVMQKIPLKVKINLPVLYENSRFIVFKI